MKNYSSGAERQKLQGRREDNEYRADCLEQSVRERAYFLWEQGGRPVGRAEEYWRRALEQHLRERAHVLWVQDGRPEGRADEYWQRIRDFEAQ
ncbi:DUF2934 domain-containing protein [Paraburkholderia sp. GAS41]|uniref:DUF2934 domain-containing protein n=1 Tax=Paraburkholderia sp. GAS41 TaxID=3035134 RepID=UPI003D1C944C